MKTYKIITEKYQGSVASSLIKEEIYVTRGNDLRLEKLRANSTQLNSTNHQKEGGSRGKKLIVYI